ncbi:MAG: ATP-dependent DNA helicase [Candidatus Coatesbacteria bacterium]|nr:ATP-dependent DNA helicase [Candidatus Coatesbacteria bacterium]
MNYSLEEIFSEQGLLSRNLEGYEFRPQQLSMSLLVEKAIIENRYAMVEAGTGVGKTFAYIIPYLLQKKKVIISTATKNLQGQLIHKDLPFLQKMWSIPFSYMMLKGRQNYICLEKFDNIYVNLGFRLDWDDRLQPQVDKISKWLKKTDTGDLDELDFILNGDIKEEVSSNRMLCYGHKCPSSKDCFIQKARRRAMTSDILVVNHHLLFAELAMLSRNDTSNIPAHSCIVFDEAHTLEEVATQYFGYIFGNFQINMLLRGIRSALRDERIKCENSSKLERMISMIIDHKFWKIFEIDGLFSLEFGEGKEILSRPETLELINLLNNFKNNLIESEGAEDFAAEIMEFLANFDFIMAQKNTKDFCYLKYKNKDIIEFQALPLDVSDLMAEGIFKNFSNIILTSATLTVNKSFDYLKNKTGFATSEDMELISTSPFDFETSGILYVPRQFAEPNSEEFPQNVALEMEVIIRASKGSALCLFTSIKNMNEVYEILKKKKLPYNLLMQGESSRDILIDKFRKDETSVLFGVSSFWQGIDVIGPSLKAVIIDKLPFPSPGDPLVDAKTKRLESLGKNWFKDYSLPQAIMLLRQGVGRLIRSTSDWGIVAILDYRINSKFYGKQILDSLPAFRKTGDLSEVIRFLQEKEEEK